MNAPELKLQETIPDVHAVIDKVCDSIAPAWPLDKLIAVSPYWTQIDQAFESAARSLGHIAGSPLAMPLPYYRELWQKGQIEQQHLSAALNEKGLSISLQQAIDALNEVTAELQPAPLLCDALDQQRERLHEPAWCDTIKHQIGQFCAAYFDRDQAEWHPERQNGLYASWRAAMINDHSVALLMRSPGIPQKATTLPEDATEMIVQALSQLEVPPAEWTRFLQVIVMRVSGWAASCAYRRCQARLSGADDTSLLDILAIRLSWECLIDDSDRSSESALGLWHEAWMQHFEQPDNTSIDIALLWQRAHEISYQSSLFRKLSTAPSNRSTYNPRVQAVFCIDVRSEVFRRHLEAQSADIQTLGFAGFFGLPISYAPLGTNAARPQLPGLLAPAIQISDSSGNAVLDEKLKIQRQDVLKRMANWRAFQTVPSSAFTLVETLGLSYVGKLLKRTLYRPAGLMGDTLGLPQPQARQLRPTLQAALAGGVEAQADIASQALIGMNLTDGFAPLVLLVGHGSQSENNPQRAGLDCGACCGQTGEVNARALAGLLNDADVRRALQSRGIAIPDSTQFVAALHNTTTDEVSLFDSDNLQLTHAAELRGIQAQLAAAGEAARCERAPKLGLEKWIAKPSSLMKAYKKRACDWAETRPEWGLANNAALVVAPRVRTRGLSLDGRSFLHEYDAAKDPDGVVLEKIMTAPMLVAHWINMQYYGSTVDNKRYGSGNKTLHNVVGGRLGVFEGNGGDLRIGLALQSVYDGQQWRHEPLRLTVVIEASREAIDKVIRKHALLQNLLNNEWLYLARWEHQAVEMYRYGRWEGHLQPVM